MPTNPNLPPTSSNLATEDLPPIKNYLQSTFHDTHNKFSEVRIIVDEMIASGWPFKIPTVFKIQLDKVKKDVDELHRLLGVEVYRVNKDSFAKMEEGKG